MKRYNSIALLLITIFLTSVGCSQAKKTATGIRMSEQQAQEWYEQWGWLKGCNFQPSTAINQLEMWQDDTFDPETIDKELGWAADIGMNCMRVYLHHAAWQPDKEGFKKRVEAYLAIADKHRVSTIFVFFDDCWNADFETGKQPDPKPGVHNSGWVRDPGDLIFRNPTLPDTLEVYVKDILYTFNTDRRIVCWDLYNEPGNSGYHEKSFPLLKQVFTWAREVNPTQPLTVGVWNDGLKEMNQFILEQSDIISYHNYRTLEKHQHAIDTLKTRNRPMICTEYMNRRDGSLFQNIMPLLKSNHIGAINWGCVAGKTNTIYAWDQPLTDGSEPTTWFHDIFRKDGIPYSEDEIKTIKSLTGK